MTKPQPQLVLELRVEWSGTLLAVRQLDPARSATGDEYLIGEDPRCDLWVPRETSGAARLRLVEVRSRSIFLRPPPEAIVTIQRAGSEESERYSGAAVQRGVALPGSVPGALYLPLDEPALAISITWGSITVRLEPIRRERLTLPPRPRERGIIGSLTFSSLCHAALLLIAFLVPPSPSQLAVVSFAEPNRFVAYLVTPVDDPALDGVDQESRRAVGSQISGLAVLPANDRDQVALRGAIDALCTDHGSPALSSWRWRKAELWLYPSRYDRQGVWRSPPGGVSAWQGDPDGPFGAAVSERLQGLIDPLAPLDERSLRPASASSRGPLGAFARLDPAVLGASRRDVEVSLVALVPQLAPVRRPQLDVSLVLERSQRMSPAAWTAAATATQAVIDRLAPQDRVSLISYAETASLDVPSRPLRELFDVQEVLDQLPLGGEENLRAVQARLSSGWTPARDNEVRLIVLIRSRS